MSNTVEITSANPALADLKLSWNTAIFSEEDGLAPLDSLHEAGDALVALALLDDHGTTVIGSGVMVGPGLMLTATHVLDEFPRPGGGPVCLTFLPDGARAWLPIDIMTLSGPSQFDDSRNVTSDMALVSCTLNSDALADAPLTLAPMKVALPLIGDRLWAVGFRHQKIEDGATYVTPLVSSGLVTAAYPDGRGEHMASPCFEVAMDTVGGMSGGAVMDANGFLVGILSSSFEGGPSYVTLIWEALRVRVKGAIPILKTNSTISLIGASALRQAKLVGNVNRDPWGQVRLRLSDAESELLRSSLPATAFDDASSRLTGEELEAFKEAWGVTLEEQGRDAMVATLNRFSIERCRESIATPDMPLHCLEAIESFEVEDFDGVEDLEIASTEVAENGDIEIDFWFEIQHLIWTLTVPPELYKQHKADFDTHFVNPTEVNDGVEMDVVQRGYFRATTTFHQATESFSDPVVTSSAMLPRRRART
jgi:hypothetical protein